MCTVHWWHYLLLVNLLWAGYIRIRIGGITSPALSCLPILTLAHHGATRCMREIGGMTTDKARRTAFPKATTTSGECRALLSHASQAGRVAPATARCGGLLARAAGFQGRPMIGDAQAKPKHHMTATGLWYCALMRSMLRHTPYRLSTRQQCRAQAKLHSIL